MRIEPRALQAGIKVLLCISGLNILMQTNTSDKMVLKPRIIYLPTAVSDDSRQRKKKRIQTGLSHRHIGGRSQKIHIPTMKLKG